jgi:hypothetical protein
MQVMPLISQSASKKWAVPEKTDAKARTAAKATMNAKAKVVANPVITDAKVKTAAKAKADAVVSTKIRKKRKKKAKRENPEPLIFRAGAGVKPVLAQESSAVKVELEYASQPV